MTRLRAEAPVIHPDCEVTDCRLGRFVEVGRGSRLARIGHDTWIGHAAVVMPGAAVGDGAVVAAGAVVTRDVGPYQIVAGVPARPLRERRPPAIAARLIALAWWDWDHARLRAALEDFRALDALAFLNRHGG